MLIAQRGGQLAFFGYEEDMIEAVAHGEVEAAAVSPARVGYFNLRHPDAQVRFVHAYDAEPELRWNLAVGLRRADTPFREAIAIRPSTSSWPTAPSLASTRAMESSTVLP